MHWTVRRKMLALATVATLASGGIAAAGLASGGIAAAGLEQPDGAFVEDERPRSIGAADAAMERSSEGAAGTSADLAAQPEDDLRTSQATQLALACGAFLVGVAFALLFGGRIARRDGVATEEAARLAGADLAVRLPEPATDVTGDPAKAFDESLARARTTIAAIAASAARISRSAASVSAMSTQFSSGAETTTPRPETADPFVHPEARRIRVVSRAVDTARAEAARARAARTLAESIGAVLEGAGRVSAMIRPIEDFAEEAKRLDGNAGLEATRAEGALAGLHAARLEANRVHPFLGG